MYYFLSNALSGRAFVCISCEIVLFPLRGKGQAVIVNDQVFEIIKSITYDVKVVYSLQLDALKYHKSILRQPPSQSLKKKF